MNKSKKVVLGTTAVLMTAAVPIIAVTSCSRNTDGDVFFVSDGGSIYDKSFNQQGAESVASILGKNKLDTFDYNVPKGHTAAALYSGYEVAKNINKDIVVGTGFLHQAPVEKWVKMQGPDAMKFILADVAVNKANDSFKGSVAGIQYKTKQSGFLAGYLSAQYLVEVKKDKTPTLGTFGGGAFPAVTNFMVGFIYGAKAYNDEHPNLQNEVKFAAFKKDVDFTNSGFLLNKGRTKATKLIEAGADVILPVAGPQTTDVIDVIRNMSGKYVVGVDTDQKLQYPGHEKLFITSITKDINGSIVAVYNKVKGKSSEPWAKGFGDTTWGDINNKLTSVAEPGMDNAKDIYKKLLNNKTLFNGVKSKVEDKTWQDAISVIRKFER